MGCLSATYLLSYLPPQGNQSPSFPLMLTPVYSSGSRSSGDGTENVEDDTLVVEPEQGVLGYPLEHASGLEDEGGQDDSAEVGAGSKLGDDVHQD